MIDHKRKMIFIHIARTGGTSIEDALVCSDWWNVSSATKHISARMAKEHYGEDVWDEYTTFTVVRNPWDRLVSMWATKWWHSYSGLDESCSFEEFVLHVKPHEAEKYNTLHMHEILNEDMDYVLKLESLQQDFSQMLAEIGCENIVLPHRGQTKRPQYKDIFTEKARLAVASLFKVDIELYGY